MLTRIIDFSLHHRVAVIAVTLLFAALGLVSLARLDVDAFPDVTPVQIQVNTVVPQLNPEEVEQRVTYPVEQALAGMPHLESVRSLSKFGLSQVVVTFRDGTDMLVARQLISERLATVVLPPDVERPKMGPMSNGLGEVFHYVVLTAGSDRTKARTVHEWVIRPQIRAVPGVAEVNSWGGFQKQYQVRIDPAALVKYDLTFDQVVAAIDQNNRNVGGGVVQRGGTMLLVHGVGRVADVEELRTIVVASRGGQPVYLRDIGEVGTGDDGPLRRGAVTFGGRGEVTLGLGFMTTGENSHTVSTAMRRELAEVEKTLPRDVAVVPVYDRTELIDVVVDTAKKNLFEGGLLVVAVLFAFLGNLRAAFIVALAIPLSMLFAFTGMYRFAISASLLSLGAIDFGMIVDSSVVMVENCVRKSAEAGPGLAVSRPGWRSWFPFYMFFADQRIPREIVRDAAVEVRQPTLFGELIILVVYLPVLTLEGIEGRLFRPMALTVIFALAGSMLMSITLMPVLASLVLPRRGADREPWLVRGLKALYAPVLHFAMRFKSAVLALAAAALGGAFLVIAPRLGEEYVPELSEGALTINVIRPVGTSVDWSVQDNTRMEQAVLRAFPDEARHVWSRVGSADVATDPMGTELTDFYVTLRPRDQWKRAKTQEELAARIEEELRAFPGSMRAYSQPIAHRIGEVSAGARGEVVVSVFGDDLARMTEIAQQVKAALEDTRGAEGVFVQPAAGQPVLRVRPRPKELAHHGIPAKAILDLVAANGGTPLGEVVEGQYRFPLVALLPRDFAGKPERLRDVIVTTPAGERIPLYQLADLEVRDGPPTIHRERGQRRLTVTCNVRDRDLAGFVEEARAKAADIRLPEGGRYAIEWGGQYEDLQRAKARLWIVRGLALFLVVSLLYLAYGNLVDTLRVLVGIPFALVGGVVALWLRDMPLSVSAQIGFIAVAGVAVLDDMILVSYIRQLRQSGMGLDAAVEQAAMTRLRPVLMTTLVASLGFVPMAFSTGQGAEVQRPLATVVIGGVISALVMSLLVLRVLYVVFRPRAAPLPN